MTKEQILKQKRIAKFTFRALVRKAHFNSAWLSAVDGQIGPNVKRNVAIILNRSQRRGSLSLLDKKNLKILPTKRTAEQLEKIQKLFDILPCMQYFSPVSYATVIFKNHKIKPFFSQVVRKKLASVLEFQFVPKGRRIYIESHFSMSMYFILSGEILISKLTFDRHEDEIVDKPINFLQAGEYFGQLGLLYNQRRYASCTTQSK